MNISLLILGLVPLIVFVIVSFIKSDKLAVWAAMATGIFVLVVMVIATGEWDESILIEMGLVLALGTLSLKMNQPMFFKFQPVIVGIVLAGFLAWYQFILDESYFIVVFQRMTKIAPEYANLLSNDGFNAMMHSLSTQMIVLLLLHAAAIAWAARRFGNLGWLLVRLGIYPVLFVIAIANSMIYLQPPANI